MSSRYPLPALARTLCLSLLLLLGAATAQAQSRLLLSAHADFSTQDRLFDADGTLYLKVVTDGIDATAVTEAEYDIEPLGGDEEVEGRLTNHLDGTFTAAVDLSTLSATAHTWRVKVKVEEDDDRAFEARATFVLRGGDTQNPDTFVLRGEVTAATDTQLTLAGETILLTGDTRILLVGNAHPTAADLVGLQVLARVQRTDGGLVALEVLARADRPDHQQAELEVNGTVEAMTETSLTVLGLTFDVDARTEIEGEGGAVLGLADLSEGTRVALEAVAVGEAWLATEIEVHGDDDDDDKNKLEGTVDLVGDAHLTVAGLRFDVTADTEFEGIAGLNALQTGDAVSVQFIAEAGAFVAIEIEREEHDGDGSDDRDAIEAEGVITALGDATIEVEGLTFTVTDDTRIRGDHGGARAFADLTTGMEVEVKGFLDGDVLVARSIEVENALEHHFRLKGVIRAMGDSTLVIGHTRVFVTSQTVIFADDDETTLAFADLAVGMLVQAAVTANDIGLYTAERIEVEGRFGRDEVKVTGRIQALGAATVTVADHVFHLTAETRLLDYEEQPITLAALTLGQVVRVKGKVDDQGTLVATQVRLQNRAQLEGRLRGVVTAVSDDALTVAGVTLRVGEQTRFKGEAEALADVQVGQRAKVRYRLLADGSRFALRIQTETTTDAEGDLSGTIEALDGNVMTVAGVAVTLDISAAQRAALFVGAFVEADVRAVDGVLTATSVEVKDASEVTAVVETRTDGTLVLHGLGEVLLTDDTFIVGADNTALTQADITAGALVEVFVVDGGTSDPGAQPRAERIAVQEQQVATGIADRDDEALPQTFALGHNYPNPFNPTTTIDFDILQAAGGSGVPMSLVVYDVLGREVATLRQGTLAPGHYRVTWNGRDAAGRLVASGVYLYRLQAGSQVQTRTMTLLK